MQEKPKKKLPSPDEILGSKKLPSPDEILGKKKESSEPTSQERPSASPTRTTQPSTSSATEPPTRAAASVALGGPIKSATDIVLEGSRQIAQKEGEKVTPVNTFGQQEPDVFKGEYKDIATGDIKKTVPTPPQNKNLSVANDAYNYAIKNLDKQKSIDRLNDELNDWQLSDRISSGIKGVYNTLVANPYNALNELLGGDKDYFTSKEYRPLQLEMKQALKELKDEKGLKASISQEEIFEKAKQIFLKNDEQEQLHQLIDAALPRGYDREGVWKELKLKELKNNALLKSKIASAKVFKSQLESYNNVANAIKSGNATQEQISEFEDLKEKAIVALDGLKYLQENYDTFLKEAKTDEEKLELFKYNYNDFEKNWNLLSASTKNIFAGSTKLLADTSIFLNQSKGDYINPVANFLSDVSTEIMKDAEEQSAPFYRYKATKLNNWSDLGSFATQLGMEQIPVLTSIYFGGVPGTALVSMGSGGQKIYELEEQEKQPFSKKYSDGEKLAAGWLYSGAEFIPERLGTARILKDLERTVASASTTSRKMFMDSFFKNTFKGIGKVSYYKGLEGGTELITAESQIAIDQELLDIIKTDAEKNELRAESFFSGALMGGGMAMAGGALGFAASQSRLYSERKDIKQVREILSKINDRNLQIENNKTLTEPEKTELYKEINDLNNQAFSIVERNAKKGKDLSIQEKSFLLDINKRQGELREKAKEISDSNYTKEYKKEKIKQLTDEFNSLEQKRNNTLQGRYSVLEELTDAEVITLKDQAARELMKELNPEGTETITIDDKQISKRAIEIYNNQRSKTAEPIAEAKPLEAAIEVIPVENINEKTKQTNAKIKRKDLFDGVGSFSRELGGSDVDAVPVSHSETEGIEFVQYANPNTGSVDVIVTGTSDNDFVGFYRIYENGKPTNKWSSKFENQSRNKEAFKTMIGGVQSMLPKGHEYTEKTSISTDGLRVWAQQLGRGYELQYDENGKLKTNLVAINGDAIVNDLGIPVDKGNFESIRVKSREEFETVKKALLPYLQKFGLNEDSIKWMTGTVKIELPILASKTKAEPGITPETMPTEVTTEAAAAPSTQAAATTTVTYNGTEYSKNEAGNWVNNKTGNEVKGIGVKGKALISALNNMAETETITQPQPTVTEQAPKTEIEEALDDIVRPKTTNIKDQVERAKKALSKIMKGVEIILHDTEESYSKATNDRSRGAYIDGKIHLNPAKADRTSVAHEVFHAVLLKYIADGKPATILTNKMLKAVARSLKGKPKVMATINEFVKNGYKGQKEIWSEEKLAEVLGYLASEYETLPQPTKNIIQKWLEKIAIMLKMKPFTDKEVIDFMNTLAERVREGQEITEQDVKILSYKSDNNTLSANRKRSQAEDLFLTDKKPKLSSTKDVAIFLDNWVNENKIFDKDIKDIPDNDVVREFADHISAELNAWSKVQGDKYISFYDDDIAKKANPTLQKYAKENYGRELKDEEVKLFHLVSAFASPSANPYMDSWKGFYIFNRYMKTGELSGYSDKMATVWETLPNKKRVDTGIPKLDAKGNPIRSKVTPAYSQTGIEKFQTILDKNNGDLKKAMDWMTSKHSFKDISEMFGYPLSGPKATKENEYLSKKDGGIGVFGMTGAKLGSYILNRFGNFATVTKDMWYARTMARLSGEKLTDIDKETKKESAIKTPWAESTKEGKRKRELADKAFKIVADNLGTSPAMVQERIWDFEKRLYEMLGANEDAAYVSDGLNKGIEIANEEAKEVSVPKSKSRRQILGENAKLSQDIRDNLDVARNMELLKKSDKEIRLVTGWERGADKKWRYEIPDNIPFLKDTVRIVGEFLSENKGTNQLSQKANYFLPKELLDLYPELNDVTIKFDNKGDESEGSYDTETKTIEVSIGVYPSKTVSSLIHEVQHAIQEIEGFSEGGSLSSSAKLAILSLEKKLGKRIESTTRKEMLSLKLNKEEENFRTFILNSFYKAKNQKQLLDLINKESYKVYKNLIGEVEARNVERRMNATPEARRRNTLRETEDVAREDQIIFFKERTPKVSGRRQISPENSSNYANMTEDGKGNFVFFHFGPRAIKFIDPKKYGSNKGAITSKPEVAAMGRVGGMSQFYTMPEYQESNVSGDKYMIKVPMDKVYDFNTDPDNLIGKAKEMFKTKYPDLPFTANDQVAFITKLAEKAGYDMTVAEWNGMSRAQSTKPLKPVDTQVMDGNTITKPFNENYESNATKGFTAVVPVSKEAKLKEVYDNINNERNSQNRYDGLYRLREEASKKTQEEITKMIEESDISQEMKDAYAEAVAYEPAGRSSSRRQVNVKAIAENTKTEVDRIKGLPIKSVDGATFNMDGTKYEGGGLVVPMGSLEGNTTQEKLSPEMIGEFAKDNQGKIGDDEIVKLGLYKFKDENTVSVDLNIVIPNKYREVALEFGALIGQESLYDLDANENVKTGADGMNPVDLTDEQFRAAAASLKDGKMPQINVSRRQQPSALDRAVATAKSRGFDDKTIMNYLVSRGYTSAEATKAVLKYNKAVAEKARQEEGVFTRAGRRRISIALDKFRRITVSKRAFNTKTGLQLREFMEGNISAELREARLALEEYDKMLSKYRGDKAALEAEADKFLKGDSTANIPLEFKAVIGKFRTHIDNLTMRLIDTGTLTQAQADKFRSNIGEYVNRSYKVFDDPKWRDSVTEQMKEAVRNELRNIYQSTKGNVPKSKKDRQTYADKFTYRVEKAIGKSDFDEDVILNKMIEDEINNMLEPKKAGDFVGQKNIASKDLSITKKKNLDIPLSVRQLMGEYGNAGQNYAKTVQKLSALVYKADFLNKMRDLGLGVFFFEKDDPNRDRNEFNTRIAGDTSTTMSPLNGLYTTPELAEMFKEDSTGDVRLLEKYLGKGIGTGIMNAYKVYLKTLGTIKKMKTAYSVGGHSKNVLGNVELVLSNAYIDPKEYANAFMTLKNSKSGEFKKKMDEYIRLGILSSGIDIAEIRKIFNTDSFDSFLESRIKKGYANTVSKFDQKVSNLYQSEDDFFKILGYEIEMKRYEKAYPNESKEEIQAMVSNNIKNILPNYNRIGKIGDLARALPLASTFMSYQLESYRTAWNNIALAKQEMSSDNKVLRDIGRKRIVGALATQTVKHFIMHSLGTVIFSPILSLLASGDDDEEELTDYDKKVKYMKLMLPEYAKGDNVVITKEGDGKVSFINFSSSDPRKGISNSISATMQGKDPINGLVEGMKSIADPFLNEDILLQFVKNVKNNEKQSGDKIYEESASDFDKGVAITDEAFKVLQPGTYTSANKIYKSEDARNEALGQLTGYKTHEIDVKKNLYFRLRDLKKMEESAQNSYRDANYKFEEGKIDKVERDRLQAQAKKSADKTYNEMRDYLKAASYFGAKDYEIDEAFEKNRISDYVIKTLWSNEMPVID